MLRPEVGFDDSPPIRDCHDRLGIPDVRYPPECWEGFGFLKKIAKGIGKGVKAVGKVAHKAAPALAFIPGVGTVAAAGIGAIGGLAAGKGLKGALTGALKGAGGGLFKSGIGAIAGKVLGGGGGGLEQSFGATGTGGGEGGGGGFRDFLSNLFGGGKGLKALGGLALGGASIKASADQRKSSEAFNQKLLDINVQQLANAEREFDRKAPLRESGQAALIEAARRQTSAVDPFSEFIRTSKKRKPGEFSKRQVA